MKPKMIMQKIQLNYNEISQLFAKIEVYIVNKPSGFCIYFLLLKI